METMIEMLDILITILRWFYELEKLNQSWNHKIMV